jgi:hypothetical protein
MPLARFLMPFTFVEPQACLLCLQQEGWKDASFDNQVEFLGDFMRKSGRWCPLAIVFFRDDANSRWTVCFEGANPRDPVTLRKLVPHGTNWAGITIGRQHTDEPRKVVTLFSSKWMVYDRYATMLQGSLQVVPRPKSGSADCAAVLDAEPTPGPVPGAEMKGEYLEFTKDTLKWYEDKPHQREGLADEARVEAGDTEFQLGDGLRLTWLKAQRTYMPMFADKAKLAASYRIAPDGLLER